MVTLKTKDSHFLAFEVLLAGRDENQKPAVFSSAAQYTAKTLGLRPRDAKEVFLKYIAALSILMHSGSWRWFPGHCVRPGIQIFSGRVITVIINFHCLIQQSDMSLYTWENVGPHRDVCVRVCVLGKIQSSSGYLVKIWRSVCGINEMFLVWFLVTGLREKPKGESRARKLKCPKLQSPSLWDLLQVWSNVTICSFGDFTLKVDNITQILP